MALIVVHQSKLCKLLSHRTCTCYVLRRCARYAWADG